MDIQKFKEEVNRTYVGIYAEGRINEEKDSKEEVRVYTGYVEVPYSYKDFTEFSKKQQEAICLAELCKAGWLYDLVAFNINVEYFFSED